MTLEINIPEKYAQRLKEAEEIDSSIRDQIEIEVLPRVLRLINEAHQQVEQQRGRGTDTSDTTEPDSSDSESSD